MKLINEMELNLKAISVNQGFARSCVAAFCVQANPTLKVVTFDASKGFSGLDENELGVAVAVAEGNKELQEAIDGALQQLTVEQRRGLMDGALNRAPSAE